MGRSRISNRSSNGPTEPDYQPYIWLFSFQNPVGRGGVYLGALSLIAFVKN